MGIMINKDQTIGGTLGAQAQAQAQTKQDDKKWTLSILIDLSHPVFADRSDATRLQLAEMLAELAGAAVSGTESAIVTDQKGVTIGGLLVQKQGGSGHAAVLELIEAVARKRDPELALRVDSLRKAAAAGTSSTQDEISEVVEMLKQAGLLR